MNTKLLTLAAILVFFCSFTSSASIPERKGWWKFDDAVNMTTPSIGDALTVNGSITSVNGPAENNLAVQIGVGSNLAMSHGISANGGGASVNEYTIQLDINMPVKDLWHSLFNTDPANSNDGECFINASNKIGASRNGYSADEILENTWYRVLISVKNGSFYKIFVNGQLWLEGAGQDIDGRDALAPVLLLFADEDGEDNDMICAEAGIWDVALDIEQAQELGNALNEPVLPFPVRKGWWKFDDSDNLTTATIGEPLSITGSLISVPGPADNNFAVEVGVGTYLTMNHGINPNGGGTKVNEYTLQLDILMPEGGLWHSLFNTDPGNTNDGECFINANNNIGANRNGFSSGIIAENTWYRVLVSVKNGSFYKIFVDGELWVDGTGQDIDGRDALETALLLFADEDGEDNNMVCAEAAIWDVALTAEQALELGKAADKIITTFPVRKGWWKFNDPANLTAASLGQPLSVTGTVKSVSGPFNGNLAVEVGVGSYLSMTHGIAANGGGSKVNEYTLQLDVMMPVKGLWHSLFNTDPANSNDGDCFINASNKIGASRTGYSSNEVVENTWYRVLVSVKNGTSYKIYIDGELWLAGSVQDIDSRDALDAVLLLFADEDGEDNTMICSEAGIWDVALNDEQALKLGKATDNTSFPERKGWWTFDDELDIFGAIIGEPLELSGTHKTVSGPTGGNLGVEIGVGSYLEMSPNIEPNGNGASVNEYTLMMDINLPEASVWHALYQIPNSQDDAEMFINTDNKIGAWRYGYSEQTMSANTWYRVVISVKNGELFNIYVDGKKWVNGQAQDIDGRDAFVDKLLIFNDNDGEDNLIQCSELAIWDVALTDEQADSLGSASKSTTGIYDLKNNLSTSLGNNYPNPFSNTTTFPYYLNEKTNVIFNVADYSGRIIANYHLGEKSSGQHLFTLNLDGIQPGIYYVILDMNGVKSTRKISVVK